MDRMDRIVVWFDGMDWAGYVDRPEFLLDPIVRRPQREDLIEELKRLEGSNGKTEPQIDRCRRASNLLAGEEWISA